MSVGQRPPIGLPPRAAVVSPRNLSVGASGVGAVGREGVGLLAVLQAHGFPDVVPRL